MKKKLGIVIGVVLLLLAGGVLFLGSNLDHIVKAAIEKYGTRAAQTAVDVGSVRLSLVTGSGSVSGFSVANPKGFNAAKAVHIGDVSLELDTSSVTGTGPVVIKRLVVDAPEVLYEVNAAGKNNLNTILGNMSSGARKKSAPAEDSGPSRKIIIKDLQVKNGKVDIAHALLRDKDLSARLPDIHLKNLGEGSGGLTAQEVATKLLGELSARAAKAGALVVSNELSRGGVSGTVDKVKKGLGGILGK